MILPIVESGESKKIPLWQQLKVEREALYERKWLLEKNPFPTPLLWKTRSWTFIESVLQPEHQIICDLGSGNGEITRRLLEKGKEVDAIDIAKNALKHLEDIKSPRLRLKQEAVPRTLLPDSAYDLVIALELIGELQEEEYRLFFSELARIGKRKSKVIVSTSLDPKTERGVERFLALFSTEYELESIEFGYFRYSHSPFLEKVTEFLQGERGITHLIACGSRRTLL